MTPPPDPSGSGPRIDTAVTRLLGIRHPILLAPMGDTAGGRLAAAVSAAGGLGLVGGGYADPAWLERELELAGGARVGVGFVTFSLDERPESLRIALAAGVPAIQLSFGDPRRHAPMIHEAGALLLCQVQSADDICLALEAGADVLVAQGQDAGGHGRPDRGTMGLIPSVVDRVGSVPVVAAGGIGDGRGVAAALVLGAAGASLGTRFLATLEALSSEAEAAALVASRSEDTVRTPVFDLIRGPVWPTGHDGRAVRNDLVDRWQHKLEELATRRDELHVAYTKTAPHDYSIRALWAGEGLDLITRIEPAGDVVRTIVADAATALRAGEGLLRDA